MALLLKKSVWVLDSAVSAGVLTPCQQIHEDVRNPKTMVLVLFPAIPASV
jgi:hypothetical protein